MRCDGQMTFNNNRLSRISVFLCLRISFLYFLYLSKESNLVQMRVDEPLWSELVFHNEILICISVFLYFCASVFPFFVFLVFA